MRTQWQNLVLVLLLAMAAVVIKANENPTQVNAKDLTDSKVKIIDNSRVLTPEEVDKLGASKDSIPVVVPLLKKPERVIDPKIGVAVDEHLAVDPPLLPETKNDEKLPPIPPFMPSLFGNLFGDSPFPSIDSAASSNGDSESNSDSAQRPKGIVSVILVKSHRIDDSSNPSEPSSQPEVKSSFIILRYLPKSLGNLFGIDSPSSEDLTDDSETHSKLLGGDDDVDKKRIHLLGSGDDDVDKKRVHLLGGEGDPDRFRINLDENNKGVFTGGNEDVFSSPVDQHKTFIFSMVDRMRSMFDQMRRSFEDQIQSQPVLNGDEKADETNSLDSVPFISIRTDDGQSALIPNDIGYAEKQQHEQSLNKCMMLQFMRLKASMYYRTILHLLFFAGVLLFILSLAMWTVRACRRRRCARRHRRHLEHMSIASIEAAGAKSKIAAYKAWQGMDQTSLSEPTDKMVLIQAPPAYDQVYIHDKNSTLTSSGLSLVRPTASCQTSDECETKSLPPEYEEKQDQEAK